MAYENAEHPQGIEVRDRAFAKLSSTPGRLETQTPDLDARRLALLGKKQRLKVAPNCLRSFLADLICISMRQRIFGRVSLVAFSTTLLASWESIAWYDKNIPHQHWRLTKQSAAYFKTD